MRTAKASRLRGYAKEGTEDAKQKFFAYHKPLGLSTSTVGKHWENLKSAVKDLKEETDETVKNASRQYMELRKKQKKGELNPFDAAKIAAMKKLVTQKEETECPPGIKKIRYKGTLGRKDMLVCPRRSGSSAGGNGGNGN